MPMIDGGTPATEYDLNTVHMMKTGTSVAE